MRLVVATTVEDPLAAVFWQAYADAGGMSPTAVFFIARHRPIRPIRQVSDAVLLFGLADALRSWKAGRILRETLVTDPDRIFPGSAVFHVPSLNRGDGFAALQRTSPTLLVSVGAPEIFKRRVLTLPTAGAVNVHNGRLPAYRGLFGTFWEIRRGEQQGYVSLHVMVPEVDAGPVLAEAAVPLTGRRLVPILLAKKRDGGRLLARLVQFVERGGHLPPPQPENDPRSGYYGWPTWRDLIAYRLGMLRARSHTSGSVVSSPAAGALGDER